MSTPELWTVMLVALAIGTVGWNHWREAVDALAEAIDRFRGGGPPTPMHPSPAADAALLLRKRAKSLRG